MSETQDNAGIVTHPPVFYIIATLIGLGLDYLYPLTFGSQAMIETGAIIIFVLGAIVAALGLKMFATNKQNPSVHATVSKVYQSGIYAYSRNPIYLGVSLWMLSGALYFDKVWIMIMMVPLTLFMNKKVIEKEEAYLEQKFGEDYIAYKQKVRRWI